MNQFLLGLDIGSSSVKASLVDVETGVTAAAAQSPAEEMAIAAPHVGWAEQDPDLWWEHAVKSIHTCLTQASAKGNQVVAIGISYQMHGLVIVDKALKPVRPSIIWCDSRAVETGNKAQKALGAEFCLSHLLNSPGNFTASKLRWVQDNEPAVYEKIYKAMLPGDYIALKLTGSIVTTQTGLSEGIFWDYTTRSVSAELLKHYNIDKNLLADTVPVFAPQGEVSGEAASLLGLAKGTPVAYRAGDQPNNAFSLNVLHPGETAATAGTSGVIYGVTDTNAFDPQSRVNGFIHVTDNPAAKAVRNGILLCVNGTGILNSWLRKNTRGAGAPYDYGQINAIAAEAPVGADGLVVLPFGNGAERILQNRETGASFLNLNLNRHGQAHVFRAAQEGIVFALRYGFDILQSMGLKTTVIRAGNANMFLSPLFREAFVNTIGAPVELYDTDGAKGAALGAGIGAGVYKSYAEAFKGLKLIRAEVPDKSRSAAYDEAYATWKNALEKSLT
jgi:xylulokinase